jgi:hypothetical protein
MDKLVVELPIRERWGIGTTLLDELPTFFPSASKKEKRE